MNSSWIAAFLVSLPEIIKLVKNIQKRRAQEALDKKVTEDLKAINKAFEEKDAEALNRIFKSN